MPQSLTVTGNSSSGSSVKRQRSADSREVQTRRTSADLNGSSLSLSKLAVKIPGYLDKSKPEISSAFQDLEWKQRFRLFHALENPLTSPFRLDRSEIVISRNRYGNVQPWDNSRIKLKTEVDGSDYVNASPITLRSRGTNNKYIDSVDTASEETLLENKYIATQGPKDGQGSHFWYMVMQETTGDTGAVIMLTQCYEANKEKCSQYYPYGMSDPTLILSSDNSPNSNTTAQESGSVTLTSISEEPSLGSQVRILTLKVGNQSKTIYHYLFHSWPDFGRPEGEARSALLELIRESKRVAGASPRIVHCSAGVGRTGTFIALDFLTREIYEGRIPGTSLLDELDSQNKEIATPTTETWGKSGPPKVKTPTGAEFPSGEENYLLKDDLIYETVNTLREQRMMMVMNELQYAFLYEVVREVFMNKYKARPEGAVVKGADAGSTDLPKGKVVKVDGGANEAGDSGSEAETEIMEGDEGTAKQKVQDRAQENIDPYDVVAPQNIRVGLSQDQGEQ